MNSVLIFCGMFSLAVAAVIPDEAQAKIINYENTNDGSGNYKFSFETSNGIFREERGYVVNAGQEDEHIFVEGSYSYTDSEGKFLIVRYKADQNGFQISKPVLATEITHRLQPAIVATFLGK